VGWLQSHDGGDRPRRHHHRLQLRPIGPTLVNSIELFFNEPLGFGSLVINKFLDLRFGKLGNEKRRKKFHLTGISTDFELPSGGMGRQVNTYAVRVTKEKISFYRALKKFNDEPAIRELVMCVIKKLSPRDFAS
jgi:hypothetical protein